jgi:hypothetical protein
MSASGRSVNAFCQQSHKVACGASSCLLASAISLCSLPETQKERAAPSSLFDLAPDGGCLAAHIAADAGGLLHRLFTMTGASVLRSSERRSVSRLQRVFCSY